MFSVKNRQSLVYQVLMDIGGVSLLVQPSLLCSPVTGPLCDTNVVASVVASVDKQV